MYLYKKNDIKENTKQKNDLKCLKQKDLHDVLWLQEKKFMRAEIEGIL